MAKKVNTRFGLVTVGVMKGQNRFRIQRTIDDKKYQFVARSVEERVQKYEEFAARCVLGHSPPELISEPSMRGVVPTIEQYMREWLDSRINYRDTTGLRNKNIIEKYIRACFWGTQTDELDARSIAEWYQTKFAEYSGSTVLNMPGIYSLVATAGTTGLRQGELLGLMWRDVDWERNKLRVRRACLEVNGKQQISTLKTKSSYRTLTMLNLTCESLELQTCELDERIIATDPDCYVFPNTRGNNPCVKCGFLINGRLSQS